MCSATLPMTLGQNLTGKQAFKIASPKLRRSGSWFRLTFSILQRHNVPVYYLWPFFGWVLFLHSKIYPGKAFGHIFGLRCRDPRHSERFWLFLILCTYSRLFFGFRLCTRHYHFVSCFNKPRKNCFFKERVLYLT